MQKYLNQILTLFLSILFCSSIIQEKEFVEYKGGRFGFSVVNLKLYNDSTYSFKEINHTGRSLSDKGKWGKFNDNFYLSSTAQTSWESRFGKSSEIFRFENQEFEIKGEVLMLLSKRKEKQEFYQAYYKLYKVNDE